MPTHADPTETLSSRFNSWRNIIGCLIHYLKETVSVHEEISRQQIRLHHAITFPFVTQGLDGELYQPMRYHTNAAMLAQAIVKELNGTVIPRLEDLKRDLLVKIKEIRSLQSDFRNNVDRYGQETRASMKGFTQAVDTARRSPSSLAPKNDPYLLKYSLDRQIKKQLTEENYLHEAFVNIQTSGRELEKVVYIEIQTALTVYAKLMGQQAQNVFDGLISKLDSGILTKDPAFEWDSFVAKDTINFIDLNMPMRHLNDIRYRYQTDPVTLEVRSGFLERKSKYLKSYARGWYVLTACFIHEFKSPDRKKDPIPVMSLSLDECQIAEHSRKDERNPNSYHKFVLHAKQNGGLLHKGHNWVFRAESYDAMMQWYNDLKRLTQLPTPQARSTIAWERRKNRRLSGLTVDSSPAASITSSRISGAKIPAIPTDQSSFRRVHTSQHNDSLTNRSIDTMLSMPKSAPGFVPPNGVSHQGLSRSMVTNDVVVSLPNDSISERLEQVKKPIDSNQLGQSAPYNEQQVQQPEPGYVDGELSQKVGELDVSDDPRKETQM
ncbi:DEKNAAC100341 [Brettanomyces naardenensis]|uniref:DEKNAAC100342 n=1 Tax=Brettanomyces naardenensis TaxID=13370 RepID=A0A448YFX9_BRENA|nr:DEKNAAC100341 [Brettanomyces naardenensis]